MDGLVYVVDDDHAVRDSLALLLRSVGLSVAAFASADEFIEKYTRRTSPACVVLDIRMPGTSGLELLRRFGDRPDSPPIIILTGHGDVPMAVESMKAGAIDFIQKPFRDQELLDRIHQALGYDATLTERQVEHGVIARRVATLTPRERDVMQRVVAGDTNKAIAYDLTLSERTVEIHRARVMKKMQAESLPELVEMLMKYESHEPS